MDIASATRSINNCKVLYDTGSQRNFVSDEVACKLNLPSVKSDVDIVIHGFNSSKKVKTRVVRIDAIVASSKHSIEAIVVPSLNLNINIPNLRDIECKLIDIGYKLADRELSTNSEIDLVMGSDAVKLLCPSSFSVSDHADSSVFLSTKLGVILLGCTNDILKDLSRLSVCTVRNDKDCIDDTFEVTVDTCINTITDVLDDKNDIVADRLRRATDEALEQQCDQILDYDHVKTAESNEQNKQIVDYILSNTERSDDGRLIMPLPWNPDCKHLLGDNYYLSRKILFSNLNKLKRNSVLEMYNDVFREQERLGIIEKIEDVDLYRSNHPECNFLPHMGIVKMANETTKVRVVYLANLCEKSIDKLSVSPNNAMLPGPSLNNKISTSLLLSRFDKYILIFDIKKAFLNIELNEYDQNKLLCLWFNDVISGDYSLVAYRNLRLSFGLRPSPAILMLALFKIMMIDIDDDDEQTIKL